MYLQRDFITQRLLWVARCKKQYILGSCRTVGTLEAPTHRSATSPLNKQPQSRVLIHRPSPKDTVKRKNFEPLHPPLPSGKNIEPPTLRSCAGEAPCECVPFWPRYDRKNRKELHFAIDARLSPAPGQNCFFVCWNLGASACGWQLYVPCQSINLKCCRHPRRRKMMLGHGGDDGDSRFDRLSSTAT